MESVFDKAYAKLLKHEGGYVNDPADPGGETRYGISKRSYPDIDIKSLTIAQAREIYRRDFWEKPGFSQIQDPELAGKVFDLGVNIGTARAAKFLQGAANIFEAKLKVDGIIGPMSLRWINGFKHPKALISALEILAGNYYIRLGKARFLAGWLIRLDE